MPKELLVIMALLLPADPEAREAARRGQCKSNMKQIGLPLRANAETLSVLVPSVSPRSPD